MANPIIAARDYIRHSIAELKKVTWPSREMTTRFSVLVIVVSLAFAAFFATLDFGLQTLVDATFIPNTTTPQPVPLPEITPELTDAEGNPIEVTTEPVDAAANVNANGELVLPSLE